MARDARITEDDVVVPDSAVATAAYELTASVSPPFLLNHCLRTFAFGSALARRDGHKLDREVFFLGATMHDLGFTETYASDDYFERAGATAAREFLSARGFDPVKIETIFDAIDLHTQAIAIERAPEIAFVRIGAGVDVRGFRLADITPGALERILSEWPRDGFKEGFATLVEDEIVRKPDCPLAGYGDIAGQIRAAPFND